MTQEEKQLLLQDLCARLPYGVKVKSSRRRESVTLSLAIMTDFHIGCSVKPYLRPMSSMTNQEIETYRALIGSLLENSVTDNVATLYNFLNSKHLDYRGMIHMGLALEAPKDMYNTKTE